ncbi:MAG TPA: DUF1361 domain-containing protein [Agriterribacter sp.]|nr:DUF1361 domain-containing protein [Agriterribacter sp.]
MNKTRIARHMIHFSLLCTLLMIAARVAFTGNMYGLFLVWNLFLAWVPFAVSIALCTKVNVKAWIQYLLFALWLLFFPNAPYIITDFFHLIERPPVPLWYDLIIMFLASWNGLLLGLISLFYVEQFLQTKFNTRMVNQIVYTCMILCAFGVYAGRYLRWNSWDIILGPGEIFNDVKHIALNPEDNLRTWGVTFFFSLLMISCYLTIKKLKQSFQP